MKNKKGTGMDLNSWHGRSAGADCHFCLSHPRTLSEKESFNCALTLMNKILKKKLKFQKK